MKKEIEKKYLLWENRIDYSTNALKQIYPTIKDLKENIIKNGKSIKQGYLPIETWKELPNRIDIPIGFTPKEARLRDKAGEYYFTIKGGGGLERNELDTRISKEIFEKYWAKTEGKRVEKIRLALPYKANGLEYTLEIDLYTDRALIVAEIETKSKEDANRLPQLGLDVTTEEKYKNKNLAK